MNKKSVSLVERPSIVLPSPVGNPYRELPFEPPPPGHYRAFVTYGPLPPSERLWREFPRVDWPPGCIKWQKHPSCVGMDETPGERIFLIRRFGRRLFGEKVIAWGQKNGYRPAIHLEAYEFAKANHDLLIQFAVVALGSFLLEFGSRRRVMGLSNCDEWLFLSTDPCNYGWPECFSFLFVRKDSQAL